MRVMTFNIRFENDRDGENAWGFRRDLVARLILKHSPDIVGTQEGLWDQLQFLHDELKGYSLHAPERVMDDTCQYPSLFIKNDRFDILGGEEFWLSKTPGVHRSKDWDSAFPRMMSAARLRCRQTGKDLWAIVTHLDHMGEEARYQQALILAHWIAPKEGAKILMGDFNDSPGSSVYQTLVAGQTGLLDTWRELGCKDDETAYTHHGFDGVPRKNRLDWILVSPDLRVIHAEIIRDHESGRYPSDHFPYISDMDFC